MWLVCSSSQSFLNQRSEVEVDEAHVRGHPIKFILKFRCTFSWRATTENTVHNSTIVSVTAIFLAYDPAFPTCYEITENSLIFLPNLYFLLVLCNVH